MSTNYETVFIVRQDVSASRVEAMTKEFSQIVKDFGGKVEYTESWGLRTLAYQINKSNKGHYVMMRLTGTGATIDELERQFRLSEDVIRSMTIKLDEMSKDASPMMKDKDAA